MKRASQVAEAKERNRHRVYRGEPGCNVVTPIEGGQPTCENPPLVLAPPASSSVPAIINQENETKAVIPRQYERKANLRFTLVTTLIKEKAKEGGLKGNDFDKLLALYNSGHVLPGVFKEIGPISKRTFHRFKKILNKKGIQGLAPQYKQNAFSNVGLTEKQFLFKFLHNGNQPKISDAIRECKRHLGQDSVSSPATLRRYIKKVFIGKFNDVWVLERKGEKRWMDEVASYQDRDPMLLKFGEAVVADGHKLNVRVVDPISGKPKRGDLILFWDWKSTYPVGWDIAFSENKQSITSALFNALLTIGKLPDVIFVDNGKAFLSKIFTEKIVIEDTEIPGMLERLSEIELDRTEKIKYRHAPPYHPQSKPIERFFRILNDRLERRLSSYIGSSIQDKPAYLLPNESRAKALHNDWIPKVSELNQIIYQWVDEYIDEPLPKRQGLTARQMFEEGKGPGLDPMKLWFLMMVAEVKTVRRCRFKFAGVYWEGPCLYGYNDKILIRYSLSDLSKIYVFDSNDRFMGIVEQTTAAHPIKDWQAAKRISADRRAYKRETRKLIDLARKNNFLIDGRHAPELLEYIEAEDEKKPQIKIISPWLDEPVGNESYISSHKEAKIDMAADHGSPLSCPWFNVEWEMYYWFYVQDPEKLNFYDLCWIDRHEESYLGRHYEEESAQRSLKHLLCKRLGTEYYDGDDEDREENRKDYRLGCDPAIENRWKKVKDTIIIDPISGLSHPAGGLPADDERIWYEFYRGIERRFPGTLNDADWKKIAQYESTREWEFIFHESEIYRLNRPVIEEAGRE